MGWIVRKLKSWYRELCHGSQVVVKNKLRKGNWLNGKDAASNSINSSGDTATKSLSLTSTQATDDSINFGFSDDIHFQNIEIEILPREDLDNQDRDQVFSIKIFDPEGGAKISKKNVCTVEIVSNTEEATKMKGIEKIIKLMEEQEE